METPNSRHVFVLGWPWPALRLVDSCAARRSNSEQKSSQGWSTWVSLWEETSVNPVSLRETSTSHLCSKGVLSIRSYWDDFVAQSVSFKQTGFHLQVAQAVFPWFCFLFSLGGSSPTRGASETRCNDIHISIYMFQASLVPPHPPPMVMLSREGSTV